MIGIDKSDDRLITDSLIVIWRGRLRSISSLYIGFLVWCHSQSHGPYYTLPHWWSLRLRSRDFGSPQCRLRLYIVGVRQDVMDVGDYNSMIQFFNCYLRSVHEYIGVDDVAAWVSTLGVPHVEVASLGKDRFKPLLTCALLQTKRQTRRQILKVILTIGPELLKTGSEHVFA